MPAGRKPDADDIIAAIDTLAGQAWLDARKKHWPDHIYHFNDVRNIASTLRAGCLYSRSRCLQRSVGFVDVADQEVVRDSSWTHAFARFYFRPHTPTQYNQEGIRPTSHTVHGAHCPVPIFLLFDSRQLLSRPGVEFTDGNFGASGHGGARGRHSDARFLREMPWELVYHDEAFRPDERSTVIYHRHAEVLYRDEIDLSELREIVCRTTAERETLLSLLGDDSPSWEERIRLELPGERLFYRQWVHFDQLQLLGDNIQVRLRSPLQGSYSVHYRVWTHPDGELLKERNTTVEPVPQSLRISLPRSSDAVLLNVEIGDALAYQGVLSRRSLF